MKGVKPKKMLRDEYREKPYAQNMQAAGQVISEARKGFDAECKMKYATGEVAHMHAEHQERLRCKRKEIEEKDKDRCGI